METIPPKRVHPPWCDANGHIRLEAPVPPGGRALTEREWLLHNRLARRQTVQHRWNVRKRRRNPWPPRTPQDCPDTTAELRAIAARRLHLGGHFNGAPMDSDVNPPRRPGAAYAAMCAAIAALPSLAPGVNPPPKPWKKGPL